MIARDRCRLLTTLVGQTMMAVVVGIASPVMAVSESECEALLLRSDVYASGKLSVAYSKALMESGRWVAADGTVDRSTILNGCRAGVFDLLTMPSARNRESLIMRREIAVTWSRFSTTDIIALKDNDDLVAQVQSKYGLDKEQAQRQVDAFAQGRQL